MLRILSIASLALAVVSAVSGHVLRHRLPPKGWATAYLEPYDVYHTRYLDFGCKDKHSTTYFSDCCHPLLKNESISVLQDRNCFSTSDNVNCNGGNSATPTSSDPSQTPAQPAGVEKVPAEQSPANATATTTTPTPAPAPATTTTATPTPTPANNGNNGGDWQWGGFGTWYWQKGNAGSCGQWHADTDMIAAIDVAWYGPTNVASSYCWKQVEIINTDNQNSVTVTIADACPSCDTANSIDLSHSAFEALADPGVGHIPIKWRFV